MSRAGVRRRVVAFVAVSLVCVAGAGAYAAQALAERRDQLAAPLRSPQVAADRYAGVPRVVFRNTEIGASFGLVASVPLEDPRAARAVSDVACDRVDATASDVSCLRTERGVVTKYAWLELAADLAQRRRVPLTGTPSRTRLSPDGRLESSTVFVAGHAYMQVGFSTATVVRRVGGASLGNLEDFGLVVDGRRVAPRDRNVWGVTFADDDRTFYATVATGGVPYLVRGDLEARTLTSVRPGAECPSLSPDGTRVAYKVDRDPGAGTDWTLGVLDLASGRETRLDVGPSSVDDQAEWLDDETLLYGLARAGAPGETDVWSLGTRAGSEPRLYLRDAWSPSVVTETTGRSS